MAPKEEATAPGLEAMPFAELVALAQSVGVRDVKTLMPSANRERLVAAVKAAQAQEPEPLYARAFKLLAAPLAVAAMATQENEVLLGNWAPITMFWMLLIAFLGYSPLNDGYNWRSSIGVL